MTFSFSLIFVFIIWYRRNQPINCLQTFIIVRKIAFPSLQKLYLKITSRKNSYYVYICNLFLERGQSFIGSQRKSYIGTGLVTFSKA